MSTNNHELTKLFYQLPGGTKTLVQNAIQSQNGVNKFKNNSAWAFGGAAGKKQGRKQSQMERKTTISTTPVPSSSNKYNHMVDGGFQ